jgi:short-subunit dehydrogenase
VGAPAPCCDRRVPSVVDVKQLPASAPLVFITGASSGIGRALAARFAQAGWRLALSARRGSELQAWLDAEAWDESRAQVFPADVSESESIIAAAKSCMASMGVPDMVIACAGISQGMDTVFREDLAVLQETWAINNLGMAATFHAFLSPMKARGRGCLVGVASVAAIRGFAGHGAYCASKAGVAAYCESLRLECRGSGVRVVTLLPGYVATPLTEGNPYPMPFLMTPQAFADKAFDALARGRASWIVIPWQMAWVSRWLRALPNAWFDALFASRARKPRRGSSG